MAKEDVLIRIKGIIERYRDSNYPDYITCVDDIESVVDKELRAK